MEPTQFQFGTAIGREKKSIIAPGRTFHSGELPAADFETMIGELQDAVAGLIPFLRERRVVAEERNLPDGNKQRELARVLENRYRQKEAEAGSTTPTSCSRSSTNRRRRSGPGGSDGRSGSPDG